MNTKIPMTPRGKVLLEEELHRLKSKDRPAVIEAIAEARAHGDLKENAEYAAAREQQGFVEGRIGEIEGKLSNATVVDVTTINNQGKVIFGATVTLQYLDTEEEVVYQIVGEDEADIQAGRISIATPVAKALIGKEEGDVVDIQVPAGIKQVEIIEVAYL